MNLTHGESGSHRVGAHSRASRASGILSRRAQLDKGCSDGWAARKIVARGSIRNALLSLAAIAGAAGCAHGSRWRLIEGVSTGMTREEVRARLGAPAIWGDARPGTAEHSYVVTVGSAFPLTAETLTWAYPPDDSGPHDRAWRFVEFRDGRVVRTYRGTIVGS